MRMPTRRSFGEGRTCGEEIDTRTHAIRRGSGHGTSEGWFVVTGGDPSGRTPDEVAYDYIIEENQYLYFPVVNYVEGDHEPIREMLSDPACLLGLSDGGAHCTSIVDSGLPSFMLAHWGRDRRRGPRLPLEHLVKRQTSETADFFSLSDRGRLVPGLRADVNIIDFDRLRLHKPELVHDMPAGGRRFVQRVDGYKATLAAGIPIFERGEHTGAMPGRLVRAGHNGHR
jgi:N-acyl-D-aspartate/D-glutamate deacylase